jgi:hypothetical protein
VELLQLSDMYEAKILKAKSLMYVANNMKIIVQFCSSNQSLFSEDSRVGVSSPINMMSYAFELLGFSLCQEVMLYIVGLHPSQQQPLIQEAGNEFQSLRSSKQSRDLTETENQITVNIDA